MRQWASRRSAGTLLCMVVALESLSSFSAEQLRDLAGDLIAQIAQHSQQISIKDKELHYRQAKIEQLTNEMAVLKRWKFGRSREHLDAGQASLLDETLDADIAAIEQELHNLTPAAKPALDARQQPKRAALPPELPRVEMHHEPESTLCTTAGCGCRLLRIGEDVAEKLDYVPGVFTVERHVRGKWVCKCCETLRQAPVPAQIIDKGIPTGPLCQTSR